MRKLARSSVPIITLVKFTGTFLTLFFIYCIDIPPDPDNPSNTQVDLELESSGGFRSEQLIIDSVGENVQISVIRFLPSYIRTTTLKMITLEGMTEWDTTFLSSSKAFRDTIDVIRKMTTAGDKKVIATVYIENDTIKSDTALLNIINRSGSNARPDFTKDTGNIMDDNVSPSVTLKNPSANDTRVQSLPLTVQIVCRDDNGIDSVLCVLKGDALTVSKSQDSLYSVQITMLTAGISDTIHFTITDNSTKHNSKTFPVVINYNRPPSELIVLSPASGATGVTRSPSFTWSGGVDPDEDSVFYRIMYGTAATSLTTQTAVFNSSPATVPAGTVLEPKTVYYWQLIAWTRAYNDTVRSSVVSFTTTGTGPAISEHPQKQQVKSGQKAYFRVVASGTDLFYQWQKNNSAIPGATTPI